MLHAIRYTRIHIPLYAICFTLCAVCFCGILVRVPLVRAQGARADGCTFLVKIKIKSPPNLFPTWTDNSPDPCHHSWLARLQKQHLFGSRTSSRTLSGKLEIPFLVGTLSHHPSSPFLSGRLRRARMPRPFSRFSHVCGTIPPQKVT